MMEKIKKYFNGSMEPEPENAAATQETDLSVAGRVFNFMGILLIIVSVALFPAIGFQITLTLFGILFVGVSIIFKTQEQILQRLEGATEAQSQPDVKKEEAV